MSAPTKAETSALRRVFRYLLSAPRLVFEFPWQSDANLDVFVDTDVEGCLALGRSSGELALLLVKHWSSTQKAVTLSSAETELGGIVVGTTEALGIHSVGITVSMHTDSAAAVGIPETTGIGRVRHLAVGQLWVQEGLR